MWQGKNAAAGRTGENGGYGDMTPPRSLSRFRSCCSAAAGVTCTRIRAKAYGIKTEQKKDETLPFFHRLRPPDKHHEI